MQRNEIPVSQTWDVNALFVSDTAWEEDYKIYRQKVLQEEAEKQCTSDLTKCLFFQYNTSRKGLQE